MNFLKKLFHKKEVKPNIFQNYNEFFIEDARAIIGLRNRKGITYNTAYLGLDRSKYCKLLFKLDIIEQIMPMPLTYNSQEYKLFVVEDYEKAHGIPNDKLLWLGFDLGDYDNMGDTLDLFKYALDMLDLTKKEIDKFIQNKISYNS